MGFGVWGLGFGVWGLGFRVTGPPPKRPSKARLGVDDSRGYLLGVLLFMGPTTWSILAVPPYRKTLP